jgi:hypothetical protein
MVAFGSMDGEGWDRVIPFFIVFGWEATLSAKDRWQWIRDKLTPYLLVLGILCGAIPYRSHPSAWASQRRHTMPLPLLESRSRGLPGQSTPLHSSRLVCATNTWRRRHPQLDPHSHQEKQSLLELLGLTHVKLLIISNKSQIPIHMHDEWQLFSPILLVKVEGSLLK